MRRIARDMVWYLDEASARAELNDPDDRNGLVLRQLPAEIEVVVHRDGSAIRTTHPTIEDALAHGSQAIGRDLCPENADQRHEEWGDEDVTYMAAIDRVGSFRGGARSAGDTPIIFLSLRDLDSWDRAIDVGRTYAEIVRSWLAAPDLARVAVLHGVPLMALRLRSKLVEQDQSRQRDRGRLPTSRR